MTDEGKIRLLLSKSLAYKSVIRKLWKKETRQPPADGRTAIRPSSRRSMRSSRSLPDEFQYIERRFQTTV